jgi:putative chitinase
MAEVWPKRYAVNLADKPKKPNDLAKRLEKNPVALGNNVYANRNGNGDEASGDGFKYRGRGYIQLTGKSNYAEFSRFIGEDCVAQPDLVATKYPIESAAFFFSSNKVWSTCDRGSDDGTVKKVTLIVNNGTLGLEERINFFRRFFNVLN